MFSRLLARIAMRANVVRHVAPCVMERGISASTVASDLKPGRARVFKHRHSVFLRLCALTLLASSSLWPMLAHAALSTECAQPPTMTVASGQSLSISYMVSCSPFGTDGIAVEPSHGSISGVDPVNGGGDVPFTYINNGDGATSDTFTILDDSNGEVVFHITVLPATSPITVSPSSVPSPAVGVAYSQTIAASGGVAPYTYSATNLPTGITLSASGTFSGTATEFGSFVVPVVVTDSTTPTALTNTVNYSLNIAAPTLTAAALAAATVQTAYSHQLVISGGTAPYYNFALESGYSLPAGLSLSSTGLITGTPTATGTTSFEFVVYDHTTPGPYDNVITESITVNAAPVITIAPTTIPSATVATAYSQTLTASGGTAPYTLAVISGALPAGLTLSASGTLSGTPTASGSFSFTVAATDATAATGTRAYTLTVAPPTLTLAPPTVPAATENTSYNQTVSASGGVAPYTYVISSGALPAGMTLSSAGVLSGTPTVSGSFNFDVSATDSSTGTGPFTTLLAYTLTVNPPTITLSPTTLAGLQVGVASSQTLTASGGTAPYTYTISTGNVPTGMVFNSSTGLLNGTPSAGGAYSFTVTATDANSNTGNRAYSGSVNPPVIDISPAAGNLSATYGTAFSQTFTASHATAPYTYTLSGTLPSGMSWNGGTATLAGTPTQSGEFTVSITATDNSTGSGPYSNTFNYTVVVGAATIAIAPSTLPAASAGALFAATQLSASGGIAPYIYSISSGSLPTGLTLSSSGALSGTPTAAGSFNVTVKATDADGASGTISYTVTVAAPTLTLTPATLPAATAEAAYSQTFISTGGTAPYTYVVTSGVLPPGLSLNNSTGALSGTPTAAGTFVLSVRATDSSTGVGAPFSFTRSYSFTVNAPGIAITPTTLAQAQAAVAYSQQLSASGGNGSYTFSISSGALPAGLSLSSNGLLSGTPTVAGSFSVTVTANDSFNFSGSQAYTVSVNPPSVVLNPATLPAATAETAYSQTYTATGGTAPYTYAVSSGTLPNGLSLNSATGALSGTPIAAGAFPFSVRVTDSSGGVGAPFSATHNYNITVNAPSIVITPAALAQAQIAVAYSQPLTASGGNGSYTFSISSGTLPAGLSLSASGLLSGTPTAAGSFNVTVTAKDGLNFTGAQAYTLSVQQAKPVAAPDTVSTPANQPVTVAVTSVDTGPITSIAMTTQPSHGTAVVNGLNIVYTPTQNYFGTDAFTYTATGPGGTSSPATVTITVTALAVPTATAQSATVLAGKPVTINATTGASGGPFSAVTIASAPATGTATVSGTNIIYTPADSTSGRVTFTYALANAFGVSVPATITVTVDPIPITPASRSVTEIAGTAALVNLTQGAEGGPFTSAAVVSISPSSAGTAKIESGSGGYQLSFTSAPRYSGAITVMYTLSNAYATSAPGTLTITVTARPDPSKDAEVLGVLGAQADATREFAQGQINNFQQRLETLHGGGGGGSGGFQNGLTFMSDNGDPAGLSSTWPGNASQNSPDSLNRRYLVQPQTPNNPTSGTPAALPDGYAVWTGGAVNFGSRDTTASASGFDFTTAGVSGGIDKRISSSFALGIGVGYGRDNTDIGHNGSDVNAYSYNLAMYGSFSPSQSTFIDGLIGYQWLSFDANRYVTADGNTVNGSRDGSQVFASLSGGYEYRSNQLLISPYGRLDIASARLDGYTEQGDAIYALNYNSELVKTTTTSVGIRADYLFKEDYGTVAPQIRLEYAHDFEGSSEATMSYADLLAGPLYRTQVDPLTENHILLGIGVNWQFNNNLMLRLEYENQFNAGDQNDQSVLINLQKKF